jgi:hypothetical protein
MNARTKRTRNFIVVFSLSILTAWLILPRAIRHAVEPNCFCGCDDIHRKRHRRWCRREPWRRSLLDEREHLHFARSDSGGEREPGKDTINFNIPGAAHTISPEQRCLISLKAW